MVLMISDLLIMSDKSSFDDFFEVCPRVVDDRKQ
jgi:hypothetical protein